MKGMELIERLISMNQKGKDTHGLSVTNFVKEKVGEDTFFGWIRSEFNRAQLPLTIFPVNVRGQGRKYVRIVEALQHPAMARQIHFVDGYPTALHKVLVDEGTHLGQWSHDDVIDALSLAYHPEIRRGPRMNSPHEWTTPYNARSKQLSTAETNRAAQLTNHEQPEPHSWASRIPGSASSDGRYGQGEPEKIDGFRVRRYNDNADVAPIDPTAMSPKRMFTPKGK
jgi:hypothetical protein